MNLIRSLFASITLVISSSLVLADAQKDDLILEYLELTNVTEQKYNNIYLNDIEAPLIHLARQQGSLRYEVDELKQELSQALSWVVIEQKFKDFSASYSTEELMAFVSFLKTDGGRAYVEQSERVGKRMRELYENRLMRVVHSLQGY